MHENWAIKKNANSQDVIFFLQTSSSGYEAMTQRLNGKKT